MHGMIATLILVLGLACLLSTASANSNGLSISTCATFSVHHSENPQDDDTKDVAVELLLDDGNVSKCFWPQQDYRVRLSSGSLIKGFILQAKSGARLPSPNRMNMVPFDTTWGPCENTMSHTQIRNSRSQELIFPITTRKSTRPLLFRYSVVFSFSSFQQDRYVEIPCCQHNPDLTPNVMPNGTDTAESESGEGSGSASTETSTEASTEEPPFTTPVPLGTLVGGHCGKSVVNVQRNYNVTRNGIKYNCTIKKPLKQTQCNQTCDIDGSGQPVICQIYKMIKRRKGYTCVPFESGDQDNTCEPYDTTFEETVTTGCQCFRPDHDPSL